MLDGYKIRDQQQLHFVTFTVTEWVDVFIDSLKYCQGTGELSKTIAELKKYCAKTILKLIETEPESRKDCVRLPS
jgi:putative transposase